MSNKSDLTLNMILSVLEQKDATKASVITWKHLQEKGGMAKLETFLDKLRSKIAMQKGVSVIEIITAKDLSEKEKGVVIKKLKSTYGKDNMFVTKTKPSIFGGIIIKKDNLIIDHSWKGKISTLKTILAENI